MINGFILLEIQELKFCLLLGPIMDLLYCTLIKKKNLKGFNEVVKEVWNTHFVGFNAFQLVKKILSFRHLVKAWNKQQVGNLEDNINIL